MNRLIMGGKKQLLWKQMCIDRGRVKGEGHLDKKSFGV